MGDYHNSIIIAIFRINFFFLFCTLIVHIFKHADYQWDSQKAALNLKKHKIDFADAVSVLEDEWGLTIKEQFVEDEQRFATIGTDLFGRVLVVVYMHRGDNIRIISARKTTKTERKTYEGKRRI